jgi:F-type H+-transporting ATPase subunit gamma
VLLAGTGKDHKHLLVVAAADSGLAGAISSSVVRAARERVYELQAAGKDVRIICVGRKTVAPLRRLFGDKVIATFDMSKEKVLKLSSAKPVADRILEAFENGEADVVTLFYSRFKNVVSQVPTARQLIPAVVISTDSSGPAPDLKGGVYTYEPEETAILEALLPQNLRVQLLSALLENKAGFYASQMTAMDNATRNAGDLISDLTKQYNRSRQAQITKELIEIISGAEAL